MEYFSGRRPRRWTQTAIDCYNKHCNCKNCHLNKLYFEIQGIKCRMKYYVIELVRLLGKPKK